MNTVVHHLGLGLLSYPDGVRYLDLVQGEQPLYGTFLRLEGVKRIAISRCPSGPDVYNIAFWHEGTFPSVQIHADEDVMRLVTRIFPAGSGCDD